MSAAAVPARRLAGIDILRGIAVIAMIVYHSGWNLTFFHYFPPGTMTGPAGLWSARIIASTFLALAGFSLALTHGGGFRPDRFWRRFAIIALAAGAVNAVSIVAMPGMPIYFGILHCIAAGSLLGILVLRLPAAAIAALGFALIVPAFAGWTIAGLPTAFLFTGLVEDRPNMADFVPLIPFAGVMLLGLAAGKIVAPGIASAPPDPPQSRLPARLLARIGRHSLPIYLIHQPVLFGLTALAASVAPPAPRFEQPEFTAQCIEACMLNAGAEQRCTALCNCVAEDLVQALAKNRSALDVVQSQAIAACQARNPE
jgi:uncharacterized membrane protein